VSYAHPHPGRPPELPELPEGAPPPRLPPRRPGPEAGGGAGPVTPWPPWIALVGLLAGFGVAIVGAALIAGLGAAIVGGDLNDPPPGAVIAATVFQDLALVGAAVVLARLTPARGPWHFGLRRTRLWPAVGWTVLAYLSFLVFTGAWLSFLDALGVHIGRSDELPSELGADTSTAALVAVGVLVTVFAPIAEETFFRGFFFTALRNWKGVALAAILTGIVFGAIHAGSSPVAYLVPLAVFGALLCLLYWRTGSLLPCIALHAINNSIAYGASQHWSWQIPLVVIGALCLCALVLGPIVVRAQARPALADDPTGK
jgi:membrane protease YdiL (CAAX protease family)